MVDVSVQVEIWSTATCRFLSRHDGYRNVGAPDDHPRGADKVCTAGTVSPAAPHDYLIDVFVFGVREDGLRLRPTRRIGFDGHAIVSPQVKRVPPRTASPVRAPFVEPGLRHLERPVAVVVVAGGYVERIDCVIQNDTDVWERLYRVLDRGLGVSWPSCGTRTARDTVVLVVRSGR